MNNRAARIAEKKKALFDVTAGEFPRAASILVRYLKKITDADFKTVEKPEGRPRFVFIKRDLGESGFSYRFSGGDVEFGAGNESAAVYAVYDWLERVAGCRYYSRTYEYVPFDAALSVEFDDYEFSPILEYREILYRDYGDPEFAEKHKITPACRKNSYWGFWCHSFYALCPPEEYFESNPEYFSLRDGKRAGKNAQLCLSNPDVLEIVVNNLKKHIAEKPEARYWSVSQNDNDAYCQCEKCRALNERDGSPMGSILNFVNRVAERFPDKIISTLAYWYSRKPPKLTRPAKNVHIMLCNIEANRGEPIETDPRSADSKNELLEWKKICKNVFLWDYCIQFKNLVSPFPNYRALAPNVRFFVENNVRSLFSQCNREIGGEFHELRGYLLAKLMWNPYIDEREIILDFMKGYYKAGGKYILEYIDLICDEMEKAGGELRIFGSPDDAKGTYLRRELFDRYEELFGKALEAVKDDADALFRVRTAAMPIYYAGIALKYGDKSKRLARIEEFEKQAKKTGLVMVEEWKITVDKFASDAKAEL